MFWIAAAWCVFPSPQTTAVTVPLAQVTEVLNPASPYTCMVANSSAVSTRSTGYPRVASSCW